MKNKILIVAVIIAFICGLLIGIKAKTINFAANKEQKEEKKTTLMGLYMTEEKDVSHNKGTEQELKEITRDTITIYNNNTLVIQTLVIYNIEGIGQDVTKGVANSYHYVINNETKSILLTSMDGKNSSKTFTFSEDYNTILDERKNEYKYFKGGIEDYYKEEDYKRERETNFEGTYEFVRGDTRTTYTFNKNGVVHCETNNPSVAPKKEGSDYYYCINNDKILIYQGYGAYMGATLSDNNTKLTKNYFYSFSTTQYCEDVFSLKQ